MVISGNCQHFFQVDDEQLLLLKCMVDIRKILVKTGNLRQSSFFNV